MSYCRGGQLCSRVGIIIYDPHKVSGSGLCRVRCTADQWLENQSNQILQFLPSGSMSAHDTADGSKVARSWTMMEDDDGR